MLDTCWLTLETIRICLGIVLPIGLWAFVSRHADFGLKGSAWLFFAEIPTEGLCKVRSSESLVCVLLMSPFSEAEALSTKHTSETLVLSPSWFLIKTTVNPISAFW